MVSSTSPPARLRRPPPLSSCSRDRFKGVRRRSWGRWVSEIRIPHSREKIWLGSYGTAEQAARAYDIASLLLRGTSCSTYLNFADSTDLMSSDNQVAALIARGIASPRTIQATASAAANSTVPRDIGAAACSNGDGSSPDNMDDDNCQQCIDTSAKDCDDAATQPLCTDPRCAMESKRGTHTSMCNANMTDSCWIQDVLTLLLSPRDRSCSPPFLSSCSLQLSPSVARTGAPSPSSTTPTPIHNAYHGTLPGSSRAPATPDCLLKVLFDDFQYPLEGFVRDGFTAIAPAVTTSKRFDTDTAGGATCDVDTTQLWSYVR